MSEENVMPKPESVEPVPQPVQAPPEPKKSEIARIITDKLLITNESYECTLVKNRIISAEEQRQELESIVIKKGDKTVINLKNKTEVRNFIDLCWNISMQLTREVTGVTQSSQAVIRPTAPPVPPVNHFVATPDGMVLPDDSVAQYEPPTHVPKRKSSPADQGEIAEAFALMERARAERMGAAGVSTAGIENPYARIQRDMDSNMTMSEQIGAVGGLSDDQLTPEQRQFIASRYGNINQRLKQDAAIASDPIQGRAGKSKLKSMRDMKNFNRR